MRHATLAGRAMAFADHGDRPPLLLVHGFPLDHSLWLPQLDALSATRRVIAPDLAGFGATGGAGHESLDGHADDLAALLDHLGIDRAVVNGLSMGGYIAFAFWRRHRARVAGLVLTCTRAAADSEAARAGRYQSIVSIEADGVGPLADAMVPKLVTPAAPADVRSMVDAMVRRQPARGVADALRAMSARPDSTPDLAGITVPTLVVAGADDVIVPAAEAAAMAAAIPGAGLVTIPGAGHLANLEEPGAYNAALRAFLERVDATV